MPAAAAAPAALVARLLCPLYSLAGCVMHNTWHRQPAGTCRSSMSLVTSFKHESTVHRQWAASAGAAPGAGTRGVWQQEVGQEVRAGEACRPARLQIIALIADLYDIRLCAAPTWPDAPCCKMVHLLLSQTHRARHARCHPPLPRIMLQQTAAATARRYCFLSLGSSSIFLSWLPSSQFQFMQASWTVHYWVLSLPLPSPLPLPFPCPAENLPLKLLRSSGFP